MEHLKWKRANLDFVNLLNFKEIVQLSSNYGNIKLKPQDMDTISKVRNLVCHATNKLVKEHKAVGNLAKTKKVCFSVLRSIKQ